MQTTIQVEDEESAKLDPFYQPERKHGWHWVYHAGTCGPAWPGTKLRATVQPEAYPR